MKLDLAPALIFEVLLDGPTLYAVANRSFKVVESLSIDGFLLGIDSAVGFRFTDERGHVITGPLSSILAVSAVTA